MSDRTVRLHRVLKTTPDKVYRAFLEAEAMSKWLPPYGFTCQVHHMAPHVGGTFRMSFHHFHRATPIRLVVSTSNWCPMR
jgi:uncharacterized protein YndB with AHSA1/START domain